MASDTYGIASIVTAIEQSQLPKAQKIAYLYQIADGSFSLKSLNDIEGSLRIISTKSQRGVEKKKSEIQKIESEIRDLDEELKAYELQKGESMLKNVQKLMAFAASEAEVKAEARKKKTVTKLKKKLKKGL